MVNRYVGQAIRRTEDPRLLVGRGRFVADLKDAGMLEACVLRSTQAHARIVRLDVSRARAHPGVFAVFTAADLKGRVEPFTRPFYQIPASLGAVVKPYRAPVLAADRVLRVGEPVAVVVANDRYVAEDARDLIEVDYAPLPVLTDPEQALLPGAPVLHPELGDNIHCRFTVTVGDPDAAFATAEHTLHDRFRTPRQIGSPMETRGILARPEPSRRRLEVWSTTQLPHLVRTYLSEMLHLAEDDVRVAVPDMGGGFGGNVYNEDVLIPFLALTLGRPVRWIEDRIENLGNARHSRDQIFDLDVAFRSDGRITGLRGRLVLDCGCYNPFVLALAYNTVAHLRGQLRVDNLRVEGLCVLTNKPPNTPIRGAGRPEATFAMDRLVDRVTATLGLEPVEVRRRNLIPATAMPYDLGMLYRDGTRAVYDSGDYPDQLARALELARFDELQALRSQGRRVGLGLSSCVEATGFGPHEGAIVRVGADGRVSLRVGCTPHGQSHETTLAQVCADELGVAPDGVSVRAGDTALIPYGGGTFASRSAVTAGNAVALAARRLRKKILAVAAVLLEARPEDLEIVDGHVFPRGVPRRGVDLADVARAAAPGPRSRLPAGLDPGLEAEAYYVPEQMTFASSTHVALVEVDAETGVVTPLRYAVVHDCGTVLNPAVVEGQIAGGVVHGLGAALLEEVLHDERGQLLTGTFMEYLLPSAAGVPAIRVDHRAHPTPLNSLGVKGCGEGGTTSPPAAVANAVVDALRPLPVEISELPLRPDRVWQRIEEAKARSRGS